MAVSIDPDEVPSPSNNQTHSHDPDEVPSPSNNQTMPIDPDEVPSPSSNQTHSNDHPPSPNPQSPTHSDEVPSPRKSETIEIPTSTTLEPPNVDAFDPWDLSLLPDPIDQTVLEDDEKVTNQKENELKAFDKMSKAQKESWTQTFIANRMRTKYTNLLFEDRLSVLRHVTRDDEKQSKKLLSAYNAMTEFPHFHEQVVDKVASSLIHHEQFQRYLSTELVGSLQNAHFAFKEIQEKQEKHQNAPTSTKSQKHVRLIHAVGMIHGLDIEIGGVRLVNKIEDQFPDFRSLHQLQKSIIKIDTKIHNNVSNAFHGMEQSVNQAHNGISQIDQNLKNFKTAAILEESTQFNFRPVLQLFKRNYDQVAIPRIYLNKIMMQHSEVFHQMSNVVENQFKSAWTQWFRFLISENGDQFTKENWEGLQEQHPDEHVVDSITIFDDFRKMTKMMIFENERELDSMDSLFRSMVVAACGGQIVSKEMKEPKKALMFLVDHRDQKTHGLFVYDDNEELIESFDMDAIDKKLKADRTTQTISIFREDGGGGRKSWWKGIVGEYDMKFTFNDRGTFKTWMRKYLREYIDRE